MCKQKCESTDRGAPGAQGGCCAAGCDKRRCVPILAALAIALVAVPLLAKSRRPCAGWPGPGATAP